MSSRRHAVLVLLSAALLAASSSALAQTTDAPFAEPPSEGAQPPAAGAQPAPDRKGAGVAFVLDMAFDFGSTRFLKLELSDGSSKTLDLNDGFFLAAGARFLRVPVGARAALDTVATIGFKYKSIGADDGDFRYLAYPLEVYERISFGPLRLGAGLSVALSPSFKGSGVLKTSEIPMKRSLGLVARAEYIGTRRPGQGGFFVGARILRQKLEPEDGGGAEDANAWGIVLGGEGGL